MHWKTFTTAFLYPTAKHMSINHNLSKDVTHDLKVMSNLEATPVSTNDYVLVNAQEEWESFLSIIKK